MDTTLRKLLDDILAQPGDIAPRLVCADWLEERGDPRASLLRLIPSMNTLSWPLVIRHGVSPRVHVGQREHFSHYRTDRVTWPKITPIRPPVGLIPTWGSPSGKRETWRGVHNLGRLLAIGMVHATLRYNGVPVTTEAALKPLTQDELYACRLISAKERDADRYGKLVYNLSTRIPGRLNVGCMFEVLELCRSGTFSTYVRVAELLCARVRVTGGGTEEPERTNGWLGRIQREKATLWSILLDRFDWFRASAPWHDTHRAFINSRPPHVHPDDWHKYHRKR